MKNKKYNMLRVLKLAHKPSKQEFIKIFTVVGIGVIIIGAIGFMVALIYGVLM